MAVCVTTLFDRHRERLTKAVSTCETRGAWSPFIESPSRKLHADGAKDRGLLTYTQSLRRDFPLCMPGETGRIGKEMSPYTGEPLGITYPQVDVDALYDAMRGAQTEWKRTTVETRIGIAMEILDRLAEDLFTNAYATMHTSGQAFMMAFAGSGANSLDRGLEAIVYAYKAMKDVPSDARFERKFGGDVVRLEKQYRLVPRGIAVVISCGSYPAWNAYPAIFANLVTGNPVVVKPHPNGILPMAMAVKVARDVVAEEGYDPNIVTLAADEPSNLVTKALVSRRETAIIDFTGSQGFGHELETEYRHADVYTETAGCNAVVVESTHDIDGMLSAIAQGVALFSSQMCTAPQNIFVPPSIETERGTMSRADFESALVETIDSMLADPKHAAAICGAIHSEATLGNIDRARSTGDVLRDSDAYPHPEFPAARTATPLVVRVDATSEKYRREHFGPIAFVIGCDDAAHALERATEDARVAGSIANYVYSSSSEYIESAIDAFNDAGSSVGCNLIGHRPINFTAAFSDYHVTGLNPAGNACLTDLAFVSRRFRIVQSKTEIAR